MAKVKYYAGEVSMPYPSPTARSRLTFELSRQTGLRRKPKGNISPCIIAVPRWAGDSKRGNRRDAERSQRQSRLGCTVAAKFSRQFSDEVSWQKVDPRQLPLHLARRTSPRVATTKAAATTTILQAGSWKDRT